MDLWKEIDQGTSAFQRLQKCGAPNFPIPTVDLFLQLFLPLWRISCLVPLVRRFGRLRTGGRPGNGSCRRCPCGRRPLCKGSSCYRHWEEESGGLRYVFATSQYLTCRTCQWVCVTRDPLGWKAHRSSRRGSPRESSPWWHGIIRPQEGVFLRFDRTFAKTIDL